MYVELPHSLTSRWIDLQTGSTLVLSQPPLTVEVLGVLGIRTIFWLLPSTLFLIFDTAVPSIAVSIKTQDESALPIRTTNGRGPKKGGPVWYRVIALSAFNLLLCASIQAGVELLLTEVLSFRSALQVTTTLPMPWSIVKHVVRSLLLREGLQYYIHRFILHAKQGNWLSGLHKTYFHSISAPYSFAAHYDHPAPYVLFRFIPTYLPSVILRTHLLTYLMTLSIITMEETLTLSGYSVVPGIMLGGIARRQDLHSEARGKGNFAPLGILDWIHGTSIGGDVVNDMRDEADKHNVSGRSSNALESAKESGRKGVKAMDTRRKNARRS
ncbi:hypothetical protein BJ875DRAFT_13463 [Amylocarpus encephaloides]|uniref:Fatty acid hydroxylase domain-containing protein n=1 Tax=Amylocarpus encephaloides TaxID=45428 RepID=A0A9P7YSP8_9HELO|nr:hypothetical protein BJ875DRAFT_13463 [Amylocarpus encephaloides]